MKDMNFNPKSATSADLMAVLASEVLPMIFGNFIKISSMIEEYEDELADKKADVVLNDALYRLYRRGTITREQYITVLQTLTTDPNNQQVEALIKKITQC